MATRNEVLSLFGASPEQILEKRRREQAAEVLRTQDPFQRAGGAIGLGLARLFGGEPAEVTRQRQLYGMLEGVNFESPEQMRAAAATLAPQFPDRALQLITRADAMETSQQQRATAKAQAESAGATASLREAQTAKAGFINVPKFVGYTSVPKSDGMGGFVMSQQPKYESTPIKIEDYTKWQNKEGNYADWYPSAEDMANVDVTTNAIPDNAVRFNTGTGTPVVLINGEYFTATDEGNIGTQLTPDALKALGGLVAPTTTESPNEEKGFVDTIIDTVKGRKFTEPQTTTPATSTPAVETPAGERTLSPAEQRRFDRIRALKGNPLGGRRYN